MQMVEEVDFYIFLRIIKEFQPGKLAEKFALP
jgi:hypothetical protein